MRRIMNICAAIAAAALMLTAAGCPSPTGGGGNEDAVVTMIAITGVTPPVYGETPVTSITETDQYTGTVTWSPGVSGTFAEATVYTATITLTPKVGYTFTGVAANSFTVAGADSVSHGADSGVVTAVFPETSSPSGGSAPPEAPSNLTAARQAGSTTVNLSWTDNSTGESGFEIQYSDDGGNSWNNLATAAAGSTSYNDTVPRGTTRGYRVRAVNSFGGSDYRDSNGITVPYLVSFNANEGDGAMNGAEAGENETIQLPSGAFTRTGYIFTGWNTSADGSGTTYTENADFTMNAADTTLYAVWILAKYTVTYKSNNAAGGTVPVDAAEYDHFTDNTVTVLDNTGSLVIGLPADGTAEAFKGFGGWNTEADGSGTTYAAGDTFTITEDTTLYVRWAPFEIGDTGPAGGLIFYDKGSFSDGWRYMEAAAADITGTYTATFLVWGGEGTAVHGTSLDIGTGEANTGLIVAKYGDNEPYEKKDNYAAKACYNLEQNGYDDWFLPSWYELAEMYTNLHAKGLGSFRGGNGYWSSSEATTDGYLPESYAWRVLFLDYKGGDSVYKRTATCVRPARAF